MAVSRGRTVNVDCEEKAWVEAGLKRRSRDGRVGKDGVKVSHVTVVACNGRGA